MITNFIPANSAKWGEMLEVNIHKYLEKTNTLKEKKAKARINGKKSNSTGSPVYAWNPGVEHMFWPRNSKIVYQNSRLSTIHTFNMIKIIDMTIEEK